MSGLTGAARLLLWDYERGSLAYDALVLVMAALVFLLPEGMFLDPLRAVR